MLFFPAIFKVEGWLTLKVPVMGREAKTWLEDACKSKKHKTPEGAGPAYSGSGILAKSRVNCYFSLKTQGLKKFRCKSFLEKIGVVWTVTELARSRKFC